MTKLLLAGFLFISFYSNAQFAKGDKVLGGSFSFNVQNRNDSPDGGLMKSNSFSLNPSMGFLINENFAIGGELGYASTFRETNYSSTVLETKSKSFSAGVFGQRYFNISDKFLFSLVGRFNFGRGFATGHDYDPQLGEAVETRMKNYNLTTSITPRFIFFPSPKWGFEASIGSISHTLSRNLSTDEKINYFSLNYGAISFGVGYYFLKANR